jgi:hypothetical protein
MERADGTGIAIQKIKDIPQKRMNKKGEFHG